MVELAFEEIPLFAPLPDEEQPERQERRARQSRYYETRMTSPEKCLTCGRLFGTL